MIPLKIIVTSKNNLSKKYGSAFNEIKKHFKKLIAADKENTLNTKVVYVDEKTSTKTIGLKPVVNMKEKSCKDFVDLLFKKHNPAYIVIFGSQDVFPFQELKNDLFHPGDDDDEFIPSDLPYACDSPYSKKVGAFVNPVRVVGRIPDLPGKGDMLFVDTIFQNILKQRPKTKKDYSNYFAVSASVWKESTEESIDNIFGNTSGLLNSPPAKGGYLKSQLKPLAHFYNCHGGLLDPNYYGQKGSSFPIALTPKDLKGKVTYGTVVAAECCYGAQLMDPSADGDSIASSYFKNNALSFLGSSTIAYGPSTGQGLADLICQYFIINIHTGASTGRALLEARQKFLNASGPHLDPYELKTLAQFYILGDPSLSLIEVAEEKGSTIQNRRLNLFSKGITIGQSVAPSVQLTKKKPQRHRSGVRQILEETGFTKNVAEKVFETRFRKAPSPELRKVLQGGKMRYLTFEKSGKRPKGLKNIRVLVLKENDDQILGYKVYVSR